MTRVLIAVDETEESVHSAEVAHRLFGDEVEYLAVSVADVRLDAAAMPYWDAAWGVAYPVPYGMVWPYRSATEVDAAAETAVTVAEDEAREAADAAGLAGAETVGAVGDPAAAILRAADEHAVDVIVLGTHERSWFDRLLHPSVSKAVLKETARPVLVVP
jgi:nucleotide-binding universal stress UspA family protein